MKIKLATICRKLAYLMECRLPIIKSLETLMGEETEPEHLKLLERSHAKLVQGEMISDVLPKDPLINSPLIHAMLKNAEHDARLIEGLRIVAKALEEGSITLTPKQSLIEPIQAASQTFLEDDMTLLAKILYPPYGLILTCGEVESRPEETAMTLFNALADRLKVMGSPKKLFPPEVIQSALDMGNTLDACASGEIHLKILYAASTLSALIRIVNLDKSSSPLSIGAVRMIVFQRMVRAVCKKCAHVRTIDAKLAAILNLKSGLMVKEAKGCDVCNQSGYSSESRLILSFLEPTIQDFQSIRSGHLENVFRPPYAENPPQTLATTKDLITSQFTTPQEVLRMGLIDISQNQ